MSWNSLDQVKQIYQSSFRDMYCVKSVTAYSVETSGLSQYWFVPCMLLFSRYFNKYEFIILSKILRTTSCNHSNSFYTRIHRQDIRMYIGIFKVSATIDVVKKQLKICIIKGITVGTKAFKRLVVRASYPTALCYVPTPTMAPSIAALSTSRITKEMQRYRICKFSISWLWGNKILPYIGEIFTNANTPGLENNGTAWQRMRIPYLSWNHLYGIPYHLHIIFRIF